MRRRILVASLLLTSALASATAIADTRIIFRATADADSDSFDPAAAFSFDPVTNALLRDVVVSKAARFTGSRKGSAISVSGTQYRICVAADCSDKGTAGWTVSPGTVVDGQYIQLKADAPTREAQTLEATVTVGAASAKFTVSSRTAKPTIGAFAGSTGQTPGATVTSTPSVLSGYAAASVSADAGSSLEVCADDGGCSTFVQSGTATDADSIRLRTTAPAAGTTKTVVLSVDGGYVGASWTVSSARAACTTPWGSSVADGATTTAYSAASVAYNAACTTVAESRACSNGTLSGSFSNQNCAPVAARTCTTPWGATVAHGASTTGYTATSVAWNASCTTVAQTRTCTDGTLSGTAANQNCAPATARSCTTPWGATVAHGASTLAYSAATSANCSTVQESRTCTDSVLSGTFTNQNCTIAAAGGTTGSTAVVTAQDGVQVRCDAWSGTTCLSSAMNVDGRGWGFINGGMLTAWCQAFKGMGSSSTSSRYNQISTGYTKSYHNGGTFLKNTVYGQIFALDAQYASSPYKTEITCY